MQGTLMASIYRWSCLSLCVVLLGYGLTLCPAASAGGPVPQIVPMLRPNRVLVVASVQMRDPRVIRDAWDFGDIIALLKLWGIPFDIVRLDTQELTLKTFTDTDGQPRYSTVIWTARRQDDHPWQHQDYTVIAQAIRQYHIGFIAVGNKIQEPPIQEVLGVRYLKFAPIAQPVVFQKRSHFLTRGLSRATVPAQMAFSEGGPMVEIAAPDVCELAHAGHWPQCTVRTIDAASGTHAVWIGGDPDQVFHTVPAFIKLLQRALIWTQGYALYKDYAKTVILRMDDPGSAQSAYFTGWDYPQLDASSIATEILAPLAAHHATLGVGFCPGYPWLPDYDLRHSVTIDFVDPRGIRQNIVSSAVGFRRGMQQQLVEVQSHGLTHMTPDLTTPPADGVDWWHGSLQREWPDERWYREFYDQRRDTGVDAATQLRHLRQSAEWITQDFGHRPLVFIPGGHAISGDEFSEGDVEKIASMASERAVYHPPHIADAFTYRLAADAGYGLALDLNAHYLSPDYIITFPMCDAHDRRGDFARHVPAVVYFHDRDLVQQPHFLRDLLKTMDRDTYYMSMDEWVGYLHSTLTVTQPKAQTITLTAKCDQAYGRYFLDHPSTWTLCFADDTITHLRRYGKWRLTVDGLTTSHATDLSDNQTVRFPAGVGPHTISLSAVPISRR